MQREVGNHGTGSYPPGLNGWQRAIRFMPIQLPRTAPYLVTASRVYWEQVGVNRQLGGNAGEITR